MTEMLKKGEFTEEILREYFLVLGYYAVRGVPFLYNNFDVTDIDIFLYSRPSPLTRERANVDIKRKKTPQALERIFWTKGLQDVLSFERCIVVTTDTRPDVRDFGSQHDVIVIDGALLRRIISSYNRNYKRITEEGLTSKISVDAGLLSAQWRKRLALAKSRLLTKLDFDGCNEWINDVKYFLSEYASDPHRYCSLRLAFLSISFFLLGIDYCVGRMSHLDTDTRFKNICDGLRFGNIGKARTDEITNIAIGLVTAITGNSSAINSVKTEIERQYKNMPVEILAEYLSKPASIKGLFDLALEFEASAYSAIDQKPADLPAELKGIIGLFCDFLKIDRKKVFS